MYIFKKISIQYYLVGAGAGAWDFGFIGAGAGKIDRLCIPAYSRNKNKGNTVLLSSAPKTAGYKIFLVFQNTKQWTAWKCL